jgi:hypothetical protein
MRDAADWISGSQEIREDAVRRINWNRTRRESDLDLRTKTPR